MIATYIHTSFPWNSGILYTWGLGRTISVSSTMSDRKELGLGFFRKVR